MNCELMKELASLLWGLFLAGLAFGMWGIPIFIGMIAIGVYVKIKWPDIGEKYF